MGLGPGAAVSCAVGCRCGSDPELLWLWHRLAARAPNGPLAWKPPYAVGAALEKTERRKKRKKEILIHITTGMNPEDTRQSEVSQLQKDRSCLIS